MDDHVNLNRMNGPSQIKNFTSAQQIINGNNHPVHTPHRFSVNSNYGNSAKEINNLKQQPGVKKSHNFYPISNSQTHSTATTKAQLTSSGSINTTKINNMMGGTPGTSPMTPKHVPSFLQKGQRSQMKGSLFIHDDISKTVKTQGNGQYVQPYNPKKQGRVSQIPMYNNEMKNSTLEQNQMYNSKIPSFLQKGDKKERKILYQNQIERPESSKQAFKNIVPMSTSLSSSQGSGTAIKKFKNQGQGYMSQSDPSAFQPGGSWGKKKQKKIYLSDFEKIKELGSGKYGQVFLARQKKTNFICALKVIEKKLLKQQQITEQFIRQLKIQSFLNNPNIIKMYGFFDDQNYIYIILEVGTGGQLFKQIKRHQSMPQIKVAGLMRQVCMAVNQLHSNHIIHRDIKPQNIVMNQGVLKLCDFGWSVYSGQTLRTTFCGTLLYVGPQILKGKQYDQKIDIWSLGVMMYQMLIGENPFKITKQEQLVKIVKDQIKIPSYVQISQEAKDFLFGCLQKNPDQRLSIRELLIHNFFKKYPQKTEKKMIL